LNTKNTKSTKDRKENLLLVFFVSLVLIQRRYIESESAI